MRYVPMCRTGEKGRLATLISTTLEAINVDASQFDGKNCLMVMFHTHKKMNIMNIDKEIMTD